MCVWRIEQRAYGYLERFLIWFPFKLLHFIPTTVALVILLFILVRFFFSAHFSHNTQWMLRCDLIFFYRAFASSHSFPLFSRTAFCYSIHVDEIGRCWNEATGTLNIAGHRIDLNRQHHHNKLVFLFLFLKALTIWYRYRFFDTQLKSENTNTQHRLPRTNNQNPWIHIQALRINIMCICYFVFFFFFFFSLCSEKDEEKIRQNNLPQPIINGFSCIIMNPTYLHKHMYVRHTIAQGTWDKV